jgi:serine protease inhibitor
MKKFKGVVAMKLDEAEIAHAIELWVREALDFSLRDSSVVNVRVHYGIYPVSFELVAPPKEVDDV